MSYENEFELSRQRVSITYGGRALERHSMDVRQLAPSLLALADLFAIAHAELGPTLTPPPALEVTAQREGSFAVDLWLAATDDEGSLIQLLNGPQAQAADVGFGIANGVVWAVSWLVRRGRHGRERSVTPVSPGVVRVRWADGTAIDAPLEAQQLIERMDFRRMAGQVFEPLRKEGIDSIELRRPGSGRRPDVRSVVEREDLREFNPLPEDDQVLSDNTRLVTVRIVNMPFSRNNKWRVDDGSAVLWASLADEGFLQRMEAGIERFAIGDRLHVQMRDRQLRTAEDGIAAEHTIQKVIKHHSVPPPDELQFA